MKTTAVLATFNYTCLRKMTIFLKMLKATRVRFPPYNRETLEVLYSHTGVSSSENVWTECSGADRLEQVGPLYGLQDLLIQSPRSSSCGIRKVSDVMSLQDLKERIEGAVIQSFPDIRICDGYCKENNWDLQRNLLR
jgi:hypothetical protein